jgi:hypothetical protein
MIKVEFTNFNIIIQFLDARKMDNQQISELCEYNSYKVQLYDYIAILSKMKNGYNNWMTNQNMSDAYRLYNFYAIIIDTLSNITPNMPNNIIFVMLEYVQVESQDYIYRSLTNSKEYYKHSRVLSFFKDELVKLFNLTPFISKNQNDKLNPNIHSDDFELQIQNFVIHYIKTNPEFVNEINQIYSNLCQEYETKQQNNEINKKRAFDMYHTTEAIELQYRVQTYMKQTADKSLAKIHEYNNMIEERGLENKDLEYHELRRELSQILADINSQTAEQLSAFQTECEKIEINLEGILYPEDKVESINLYYQIDPPTSLFGFYQSVCLEFVQSKPIQILSTLDEIINSIDLFQPSPKFGIVLPTDHINRQICYFREYQLYVQRCASKLIPIE